jgi:hypothetical protein
MTDHQESRDDRERQIAAARRVASGMLHEMRNVLNPIVSAVFLLEANANNPAKVRELAARIGGFAKVDTRIVAKMTELLDREATAGDSDSQVRSGGAPHSSAKPSITL